MTTVPSRRRSRIAHFKVPFVISIAAPAAGMACGGRSEELDPAVVQMQREDSTDSLPSYNPPRPLDPSAACPDELPADGMTCDGYARGQSCSYDYCSGPEPMVQCGVASGVWERLELPTCNPPPPEPPPCPDAMPTAGSDCAPDGQLCRYPGCEGPDTSSATCRFGQWDVIYSVGAACNPPAVIPACPTVFPIVGAGCAYEGQACVYGVCGDADNPGFFDVCLDGVWQQPEVPCAPPAPIDAGAPRAADGAS
jgi:hypothetical protein